MHENEPPKISIVVINAKGTRQLEKCLKYLARTNYQNYEITVVDCLTANLTIWVSKFFPNVKVIHYDYDIVASASHNAEKREFLKKALPLTILGILIFVCYLYFFIGIPRLAEVLQRTNLLTLSLECFSMVLKLCEISQGRYIFKHSELFKS